MKKLLQVGAILTVVFAFTAVAANAQINYGARVEVPFSFNVGEKTFEPGTYSVRIRKLATNSTVAMTISKAGSNVSQTVVLSSGCGERSDEVQLVFSDENGAKYLSGVTTADSAFALANAKAAGTVTAKVKRTSRGKTKS